VSSAPCTWNIFFARSSPTVVISDRETLLRASHRTDLRLSDLIGAIRKGLLKVDRQAGVSGFHGFVVCKTSVDDFLSTNPASGQAEGRSFRGIASASAFCRSIGLRGLPKFTDLIEAGHTPAEKLKSLKKGRGQYRLSAQAITAFHHRFVTITTLSQASGLPKRRTGETCSRTRMSPGLPLTYGVLDCPT
jgi:hypothetical protein